MTAFYHEEQVLRLCVDAFNLMVYIKYFARKQQRQLRIRRRNLAITIARLFLRNRRANKNIHN